MGGRRVEISSSGSAALKEPTVHELHNIPAPSLTEKNGTHPCSPVENDPPFWQHNTDFSAQTDPFFVIKH